MLLEIDNDIPFPDQPTNTFVALRPPLPVAQRFYSRAAQLCSQAGIAGSRRPSSILHMTSRSKARYFAANDAHASAGVNALATYLWGPGAVPAHSDAELVAAFLKWWDECDADGRTNFGGLIRLAIQTMVVDGEAFIVFRQRAEGLRLQLMPAEQVDESLTRELGGGAFIAAGIEFNADGERVAYWVRPFLPTQQFETWAPPVRVDARDVLHLMRPDGVGQIRGVSWFAPIMLKLADLGLLSDALLKGFQVAALNSVYLIDKDSNPAAPFAGEKNGDTLDVSLEPGAARLLRGNWDMKANTPQQAMQSVEFMTALIEEIAAGLGVPAFMVSGNVSRANYSSLRAALITFKASLEALQFNLLVPQLLSPIWNRWLLTAQLQGDAEQGGEAPEWRFPAMPEADPLKALTATKLAVEAKLMSRKEAIAARGESIERVDSDIASDPHAQTQEPDNGTEPDDEKDDSNAE
jgi:lambda family phage portal protein